jgi:hypothetical protein
MGCHALQNFIPFLDATITIELWSRPLGLYIVVGLRPWFYYHSLFPAYCLCVMTTAMSIVPVRIIVLSYY